MLGKFRNDNKINFRNTSNLKLYGIYEIAERDDSYGVRVFIDGTISDWYHWIAFEWLCENYGTIVECINPVNSLNKNEKYIVCDDDVDTFSVMNMTGNRQGVYSKERFVIIEKHFSPRVPQGYVGY